MAYLIILTENTPQVAKGKSLEEAKKIKYKEVVNSLGGLPPIKIHCSQLATEALNRAIQDYKNGVLLKKEPTMVEKRGKRNKNDF